MRRTKLSNDRVRNYITTGGVACPYCKSHDIEGLGPVEVDEGRATQEIGCVKCDEGWTDEYKLVGIVPGE